MTYDSGHDVWHSVLSLGSRAVRVMTALCVCVCVRACVRVCVGLCVRVRARARACVCACVCLALVRVSHFFYEYVSTGVLAVKKKETVLTKRRQDTDTTATNPITLRFDSYVWKKSLR